MPFKEWLEKFEKPEGEFDFDAFKADALKEFGSDETAWTAKVANLEETNTNTAKELKDTKAKNWDLFNRLPADDDKNSQQKQNPEEDKTPTIDDFFGEKKAS